MQMSDLSPTPAPPSSARNSRRHQTFPILNEAQFDVLSGYGARRHYSTGEVLFREGDRHVPMFVILSGRITIARNTIDGPQVIATHGAGAFTGEVGTLAGRGAIATAVVQEECEAIVIDEQALRT